MTKTEGSGRDAENPTAPEIRIETATAPTPTLLQAMARLIPQLSSSSPPPSEDELAEILADPRSRLFVAVSGDDSHPGRILGILTLATYRIPTGLHAVIEDVVVDTEARGAGVGAALVQAALDAATSLGAKNVDLTSRPSREAANRLYVRMGFEARQTNIYRYTIK